MILDLVKAAALGVVQGLTEFLPVSSTGHLVLAEELLGVDSERYGLGFDASLHLGTLLALLAYYGSRWFQLAIAAMRSLRERSLADADGRLAWMIALATIPAAAIGFTLESTIEDAFRSPAPVAAMLIAFSAVLVLAERVGRGGRRTGDVRAVDAIVIGLAQALALVPGVSRSGATISAGLFRDLERREAATFAFLLSAPIIAGAGLKQAVDVGGKFADGQLGSDDFAFFATGTVTAAIVGYASIAFLLRYLATNTLVPFAVYRVVLGIGVLCAVAAAAIT